MQKITATRLKAIFRQNFAWFTRAWLIFIAVILVVTSLPREISFVYTFDKGKPWMFNDLLAPFDFPVTIQKEVLDQRKQLVKKKVIPIYNLKPDIDEKVILDWDNKLAALLAQQVIPENEFLKIQELNQTALLNIYEKGVIDYSSNKNYPSEFIWLDINGKIKKHAKNQFYTLQQAFDQFEATLGNLPKANRKIVLLNFKNTLKHNIIYNKALTDAVYQQMIARLGEFEGAVLEGEVIINKGSIVTNEKFEKLNSLKLEYEKTVLGPKQRIFVFLGQAIFVLILFLLLFYFLYRFRPDVFYNYRSLVILTLQIVMWAVCLGLVEKQDNLSLYLVPISIAAIILRVFFDVWVALFTHLVIVIVGSLYAADPVEFIWLHAITGMVVIFSLINIRNRSQFYATAGWIWLSYSILFSAYILMKSGTMSNLSYINYAWFGLNALLTLLSSPLIFGFEKLFGITSEVSLMELADTNSPLLRQLSLKAPGTFQHVLQVANLAEAAAHKLDANTLLTRVGALYHDIGKMVAPMYFIENQSSEGINPHDELTFDESAQIIVNHVLDGIKIARRNGIPPMIIDFIRTHHGNQRVEYFYQNFVNLNQGQQISDSLFRYPGPKPFSRETAIVMMADAVEASSRSLKNITSEKIDQLVEQIITHQINNNQFDNAGLSFKDVSDAKTIFKKMLSSMLHVRIEYPNQLI